ncbi:MAG: cysteine--tRNA ligase [Deltaproteobacteria bacterium]
MPIYIQNTLSKKKEEFVPLKAPKVNIYSCGVTVYDESHIGHARSLYIFDLIKRYLVYSGFEVHFIRNITDIEDKIIARSAKLGIPWNELVDRMTRSYYEDMERLGIRKADFEPKATDNIGAIIEAIKTLIEKGFAYPSASGVYFNVRKFPQYGRLSGQSVEDMQVGERIEPDESKKDPLDFALWKKAKPGEPSWKSPWGEGRPGWHIECSVMSMKYLKTEMLDIHGGGRDLIFPHHENEVAQSEALTGKPFAKYWVHHGLLTIDGAKMSKSLGNYVTIKGFLDKYKHPEILKLFFLSAHYSHPVDYNAAKITEATQALDRIVRLAEKIDSVCPDKGAALQYNFPEIAKIKEEFISAMNDDFNTPRALAAVFDLVNEANKHMSDAKFLSDAGVLLCELTGMLGLDIEKLKSVTRETAEGDGAIDELVNRRIEAKKRKDFAEADRIRKELDAKGIILEDTRAGTTWRKKL